MLERPVLEDKQIVDHLWKAYGMQIDRVEFLPIGDISSAKYRLVTRNSAVYFLKLRKAFEEISVAVPQFLHEQGICQVIPPLKTIDGRLWTSLDAYACILYPFIEGNNAFEVPLSGEQWIELGAALKGVHSVIPPPDLQRRIASETFSPDWRERARDFQAQVESSSYADPVAARMAAVLQMHREEIRRVIERAEQLGDALKFQPLGRVVCHSDLHAGNLLLEKNGALHIMDWDSPMLAPKERDLMFIGGGVGGIWNTRHEEALFYQGYGEKDINLAALAYYRYERLVEDMVEFSQQILLATEGGADRERSLQKFSSAFLPHQTLDIAFQTDSN